MSTTQELMVPSIISTEIDDNNEYESEYRLRIGTKVKYVKVAAATFDRDTVAYLSRDADSGELKSSLLDRKLAGVQSVWHHVRVDVLDLEKIKLLTPSTFEAKPAGSIPLDTNLPTKNNIIAKIASFEWEIPRIERQTRAYQLLKQRESRVAPRFLGHIHEGGRVMYFIFEKLGNRRDASIEDLSTCVRVLGDFHRLGFLHGDANRYNFLIGEAGVDIIDFEHFQEAATEDAREREMQSLREELLDESGKGAGFVFGDDDL